jgi:OmcA/MtrC family decaheme c-type cytochrome
MSPSFALAYYTVDSNGNVTPLNVYTQTSHANTADGGASPVTPGMYSPLSTTPGSGTIVENGSGAGDYTYTFPTVTTPPTSKFGTVVGVPSFNAAQLSSPHVVWIRGQRQTDLNNAADGPTLYTSNAPYYFYPSGNDAGAPPPREIVNPSNCWNCHDKFRLEKTTSDTFVQHGGGMTDGTLCNVCHNPQRDAVEYGGVGTSASEVHVHRIHASVYLQPGDTFDNTTATYPQDLRNCNVCHGNALQGAQHITNPTRAACASCHDYVNFTGATGNNCSISHGVAAKGPNGLPIPCDHFGGPQSSDANCLQCHKAGGAADPANYHIAVEPPDPTGAEFDGGVASNTHTNAGYLPQGDFQVAGAAQFQYVIQSVGTWTDTTVTPNVNRPSITFKLQKSTGGDAGTWTDVVFTTGGTPTTPVELMPNFVGSPSVYWFWAVPQDGIATPADWNASASVWIKSALNGVANTGTLTYNQNTGFYTIKSTHAIVPAGSVMLTGGVGYQYGTSDATSLPLTETDVPGYPYNLSNSTGGLVMTTTDVTMPAAGFTARRTIIDNTKCQACHGKLGIDPQSPPNDGLIAGQPGFHAGQRNDGASCAGCHTNNLADEASTGWAIGSKYYIHAIHGDRKRSQHYYWNATYSGTTPTGGYYSIKFPSPLNECQACHVAGSYDFENPTNLAQEPDMLVQTVMTGGPFTAPLPLFSPYVDQTGSTAYGNAPAFSSTTGILTEDATAQNNLVISPLMTACSSCHDSAMEIDHMKANGGHFYDTRANTVGATATTVEQCMVCHGPGGVAAIGDVHLRPLP